MDLGISGRKALLCASSSGLGLACAKALAAEGVNVVINGRDPDKLKGAADELAALSNSSVDSVAADISTQDGREALLARCPEPDILLNNSGGPKPKLFMDTSLDDWTDVLASNMVAPLQLVHGVLPSMVEKGFGRIVNITSAMVTTPRPHQTLSSGARAGLTASLKALSFDVAKHNVTINNMLPERFDTQRQRNLAKAAMVRENVTYEEARRLQVQSIAAKRLGRTEEFGSAFAFLCSMHAGYISGQNLRLDGGSYPALI